MSQENATSVLASFSLSSPSIPTPSSPTPSSSSSFINEYDTSNYFSRLPNETIFNILSFVIVPDKTITIQSYSPHKQLATLTQVCRLFNNVASDVLLWQIAFEGRFDSEAIIRAGIIDKNVIGGGVNGYGDAEGEGEDSQTTTTQIQTGGNINIWKELYKERQIAINKIKNYINTTLPSPFVFNESIPTVDFMEFNFDDENESDNENDVITNNGDSSTLDAITNSGDSSALDPIITNNGDGSTLDSTDQIDQVDDNVHFNFSLNFVGNERNDEVQTDETDRNDLDFTFEDDEFRFQELEETSAKFNTKDTVKEHATNDDAIKEDIRKDDILEDGAENIKELLNLEYSTLDINVDDVVQDLDFVSEGLMKFDDPELDSLFDSDTVEIDNLVDTRNSNVVKNNSQHNKVLVKDTDNPVREVDHVTQAQDLLNPEINDDLDETYLQDYDGSSKFLDHEEEPFKSFGYEESFDKDKPQLQDYRESPTKLQNVYHGESKLQEFFSDKTSNFEDDFTLKNDTDDDLLAKEVFQLQDFEIINSFDKVDESTNLQEINGPQVEITSKEVINEQGSDLPYEEIAYIPNYGDDSLQNENVVIENDLLDYVEEWNLSNDNAINEKETNKEDKVEGNLLDGKVSDVENNDDLLNYDNVEKNNFPNGNVINEEEGNDLPNYEEENNRPNGDIIVEKEIIDSLDYNINDVEANENERMIRHDDGNDRLQNDNIEEDNVDEIGDMSDHDNLQDIRRKIARKNNDPDELIKILNVIWKICQENDGMNGEILLEANVKEFVVNLIRSWDKKDINVEFLSIALQILSILASWHPELTIDLQRDNSLWAIIFRAMNYFDIHSSEDNNKLEQLILSGSAIHIIFHTILFNSPNQSEFVYLPPQLLPDSNIFNNVYNKLNLKPGEGVIQPFNEDFSGNWCGYFSHAYPQIYSSLITRETSMDITSLKFFPSEPGKVYYLNPCLGNERVCVTDKVVKCFSGRGTDHIGEFVIKSGIITEKGKVNFIKSYLANSWIYDGILSPVGICGRWGIPSCYGNFWIWKR